ncbi:Uncharacterized protein PECH_000528 [Penicillium ucsense]|uniref:Uncharacterized protein n=1 Tax=Penicillium ucsense TaxID=2839758 RepID=A0A8J8WG82_9EURO|nr:Uncharacterized protein PECM_008911 [Penicillium ucsense]KAF7733489.1 Uncharacterized protein PECH_000528 [Penicillium ucsense]
MAFFKNLLRLFSRFAHLKQKSLSRFSSSRRGATDASKPKAGHRDGTTAPDRWIREYTAEMQAGKQIEHHQRLVTSRLRSFQDLFDQPGPSNPWFLGDIIECEEELERLHREMAAHRARVIELVAHRPPRCKAYK